MTKEQKFKKGDWCFCEFELQQIMETDGDRITSVSDGVLMLGGRDLSDRCFPLDMSIKRISDNVAYWNKEIHQLKYNSLNHPDINRELIRRWVELCENKDDQKRLEKLSESLSVFCKSVIQKVREISTEQVNGVSIFRKQ